MFDRRLRPTKDRLLEPAAQQVARHVGPHTLTGLSVSITIGAAALAASGRNWWALGAWLIGRVLDGLDGPVARHRGEVSDVGGYLDMVADTLGYAAVPVGVAVGVDDTGTWIALAFLLAAFYVNAISWAYLAAILEKRGAGVVTTGELTSITMPTALVEGAETIIVFGLFLAVPQLATWWFVAMAVLVAGNVVQRLVWAARTLPGITRQPSSGARSRQA